MSVDSSVDHIDICFLPKRLHASGRIPGAVGNNSLFVWVMGEGEFIDAPVAERLQLRRNPCDLLHGFVEPEEEMTLLEYQSALAATWDQWTNTGL